jgi:transglutaminase-like putative cysteine protease
MSLGELALGFASILFGFKHLSSGIRRIRGQGPSRQGTSRRGLSGSPLSTQRAQTPIGEIRLRTYEIRNLEDRIKYLKDLVQQGKRDPAVYEFARRAINGKCGKGWCVPEKDNLREVQALFKAIRANVRYTSDISGVDSYQKAGHTLSLRTADCDDYAVLVCSAAGSLGIPCRFKVIRTKGSNDWNHIFAQVGLPRRKPTKWISLDASVSMPMGWQAPPQLVSASKVFLT